MKRAGDYLAAIIDADLLKKAKTYSGFFSSWPEITRGCGIAAAAGYSRIRELEKGVLVVEADHPGWIQLLQAKAQGILDGARRRFPELDLRGISLTLSKPPLPGRAGGAVEEEAPAAGPESGPDPEEGDRGRAVPAVRDEVWERIRDGDFKDSLKRLEQSIRDRERSCPPSQGGKRGDTRRRTP
jgi:hypothetical protein